MQNCFDLGRKFSNYSGKALNFYNKFCHQMTLNENIITFKYLLWMSKCHNLWWFMFYNQYATIHKTFYNFITILLLLWKFITIHHLVRVWSQMKLKKKINTQNYYGLEPNEIKEEAVKCRMTMMKQFVHVYCPVSTFDTNKNSAINIKHKLWFI